MNNTQSLQIIAASLWSIARSNDRMEKMLRTLSIQETHEMTTIQDVKNDVEKVRVEAANNADQAAAAAVVIRRLVQMVADASGSATDLAELQASLDAITSQVHDSSQGLGEAIAEVPAG